MKKEQKERYLHSFPAVPNSIMEQMQGRNAKNFCILLSGIDGELFVRCFHRYSNGKLLERQRYVFAGKEGYCRYGYDDFKGWCIRKEFREPVFCSACYGYSFDNSYSVLGWEALDKSCMKYSLAARIDIGLLMEYLRIYCKYPNIEYLLKAGYDVLIETQSGYWGGIRSLDVLACIDWKSNNLLKMLHLNRTEFKLLKGREKLYQEYIYWRDQYPKMPPEELLGLARSVGYQKNAFKALCDRIDRKPTRLAAYFASQEISLYDYRDYLDQCKRLRYDLHDTAICFPRNFAEMHERLSGIIQYQHNQKMIKEFHKRIPEREFLNFRSGDYLIRQPESMEEIAAEGAALHHCVGGYAQRHAAGKLHILFIRKTSEPDEPYCTLELSVSGHIVQIRCDRNTDPPQKVKDFVNEWIGHIKPYFEEKKERKSA